MFTKLTDSNLVDIKVGTRFRPIDEPRVTRTVESIHDKGLIATTSASGTVRKFTWSQLVFLYEMEVADEPSLDDMTAREAAEQRAAKPEHVVAGPASFWDVRQAGTAHERAAYTAHNVYIASVMARTAASTPLGKAVQALIEERDMLVYSRGLNGSGGVGTDQYLAGRIAGVQFALAQFGVRGF